MTAMTPDAATHAEELFERSAALRDARIADAPAFTEPETGLPSVLLFRDRLEQAWLTVGRTNGVLGLAVIQISTPGGDPDAIDPGTEDAGPALRRTLAARALGTMREMDSLAIVSPRRLCLLVPQAHSLAGVQTAATRLLGAIAAPVSVGEAEIVPVLHAGVSVGRPPDLTVDALLQQADEALSWAITRDSSGGVASFVETAAGPLENAPEGPPDLPPAATCGPSSHDHGDAPCLDCLSLADHASLGGMSSWDALVSRRSR